MNKYSSLYLSEVFNGIQKLARSYSQEAIESLRRGSTDPGITPGEREAYARAYAKATRASGSNPTGTAASTAAPKSTAAPGSTTPSPPTPPPRTTPPPTPPPTTPPPTPPPTTPPPTATASTGVGKGGVGTAANPAARAVSSANPSLWSRLNPLSFAKNLKGGLVGMGVNRVADAVVPKFKDDSYLGQVGNELRDFALETGSGAAGAGAVSGGAAAIPGAVWGAGANAVGKLWRTGSGLAELINPNSDINSGVSESQKGLNFTNKVMAEAQERKRLREAAPTPPSIPQESKMPREAIPANAIVPAPASTPVPPTATISSTPPATPTPPKPQAVAQATPATPAKANTSSTPVYAPATPVAPKSTNATPAMQTASTQGPDDAFLNKVMGSYNSSSALDKRKVDAIKKVYKPGMTPSQIYADKGYISASRGK